MHGWGVCGKYCARELSHLTTTRMIYGELTPRDIGDALEWHELARLHFPKERLAEFPQHQGVAQLDHPLLQAIEGPSMRPTAPKVRGSRTVGYSFFESNALPATSLQNAKNNFDLVATGSSWCTQVLADHGLENVVTVFQGVDQQIFFPRSGSREFFQDRFVVFSGGKMEARKGQDIAIRAYKVLQDRHADVMLINSWFNYVEDPCAALRASPLIRVHPVAGEYATRVNSILAENGIDVTRVLTLGPRPNMMMPRMYHNSDVGLFPNRCEGGTNLVLMEYMACGKAVVASNVTGHRDVLNEENAFLVEATGTVPVTVRVENENVAGVWPEPDLEQTIEQLEFAYQNRDALRAKGLRAGDDMKAWTWKRTAQDFLRLLTQ